MASPVRKTCAVTFSIEDYTRITGKLDSTTATELDEEVSDQKFDILDPL